MAEKDAILAAIMQQMTIKTGPAPQTPREGVYKPRRRGPPKRPQEYHTKGDVFSSGEKRRIDAFLDEPIGRFETIEIEASLGTFRGTGKNPTFNPGLKSLYCFNQLKMSLDNLSKIRKNVVFDVRTYYDLIERINGVDVRRITDMTREDSVTYQRKYRDREDIIDNTKFGIRISKSVEEFTDDHNFERDWEERVDGRIAEWKANPPPKGTKIPEVAVKRYRRRTSYTESHTKSKLYGLRFDLTSVEEIHIRGNGSTWRTHKYEVEIERIYESVNTKRFVDAVKMILGMSQDNLCPEQLMDLREKRLAVQLHNNIFHWDMLTRKWRPKDPYRLFTGYWNKPKNVKLRDMISPQFNPAVTIKLNGRRYTLLIDRNGTYLYSPPYDVFKVGPGDNNLSGTVLDCEFMLIPGSSKDEYIEKTIYGFDLLFYKGKDLRQLDFEIRLDTLQRVGDWVEEWEPEWNHQELYCNIEYRTKTYFLEGTFYDRTRAAFAEIDGDERYKKYNLEDGLIFQPDHWYRNDSTYKWKPKEELTIDFKFISATFNEIRRLHGKSVDFPQFAWVEDFGSNPPEDYIGRVFWIRVGSRGRDITFNGTRSHPYPGYVILDSDKFNDQAVDGNIIECQWKFDEMFVPYRVRDDRDRPNNYETARSVWEDIMNPIPRKTIEGYTLQLMRKYHNQEKHALLTKEFARGDVILDIGSGQGGDLWKWDSVGFRHVFAIEPDEGKRTEMERRMTEGNYKTNVTILPFGAEETGKIRDVTKRGKLSGIVSFFSLTFFPQSEEMYSNLLNTIDLLPLKGKLLGIVMDGYEVRNLLEKTRHEENLPPEDAVDYYSGTDREDSAFSIEQISILDDDVIGNEIRIDIPDSRVLEQNEWLFYFEPFKRSLEKRGFKLLSQGFLNEGEMYDKLPQQSKIFSGLNRAFMFERVSKKEIAPTPSPPLTPLSPEEVELGEEKVTKLLTKYPEDLYYVSIQLDASNFIHAILRAISPEYYDMSRDERAAYATKIRRVLARKLSRDMFESLHGGELAERLQSKYLEEYDEEDAAEIAFLEFKLKLLSGKEFVGEVSMLELASHVLGIDIYVLTGPKAKPSKRFAGECKEVYVHNKAVVLYTIDGMQYYLVARRKGGEYYYLFNTASKFIKELEKLICD